MFHLKKSFLIGKFDQKSKLIDILLCTGGVFFTGLPAAH